MAAANTGKDTVYVDVDDEITTIIDKVRGSKGKIVALVLPKRSTVFQSIVNMKLLKRASDNDKKNIVLITTEAGLMPLAASVGLHVAPTLQSRPAIPKVEGPSALDDAGEDTVSMVDDEPEEGFTAKNAGSKSVGELAAASGAASAIETINLGDEADEAGPVGAAAAAKVLKPKLPKKNKKLAIPNFDKFRLRLFLGGALLILLIVGLVIATTVLPKATVAIATDSTTVTNNMALTLDTKTKTLDQASMTLPATIAQVPKTASQQVPATGTADKGTRASGQITITNCGDSDVTIPAGTGFSANGKTYISQSDVTVPQSTYKRSGSSFKCNNDGKGTVNVTAQKVGDSYNADATDYTIANGSSDLSATGGAMTGGTSNIVKVVSQTDVDTATNQLKTQTGDAVKGSLTQQLQQDGLFPISATFSAGTPQITTSSQVGDQADTVTVTSTTTYTMFGVQKSDLTTLIDAAVKKKIDTSKQELLDDGLSDARFQVTSQNDQRASVTVNSTAKAGPHIVASDIKKAVAGQKSGEVEDSLKKNPGIQDVQVKLSPFWVNSIPKNQSKITILVDNAVQTGDNRQQ